MSLTRMESALGYPLFQRMQQGMVTTDTTARLIVRAKRIAAELRHMMSDLASIGGTLAGNVNIGALPLGRTLVLPVGIAAAVTQHPALRITTVESPYEVLEAGLRNGDIDFIFGALRTEEQTRGLIIEPLFQEKMAILVKAGHHLSRRLSITLNELLAEQWILPRPEAPGRKLVDASFIASGLPPPHPAVETGDLAILRGLLLSSNLLTAISPRQFFYELETEKLVVLPVELKGTVRQIGITTRQGAQLSPAAEAALSSIRAQALKIPSLTKR